MNKVDLSKLDAKQRRRLEKIVKLGVDGLPSILEHIFELEEKIDSEIPDLKEVISRMKGDAGYSPKKGIDYEDGYTPVKGKDYKDGEDYVLTESDKKEIASKVKIPIQEKIIEKRTETVIKEIPIVRETIKETIKNDLAPQEVRDLLELLQDDDRLDARYIKNIEKLNPPNGPMLHPVALGNLPDVSVVGVTSGQVLEWNGTYWTNGTASGGGFSGLQEKSTTVPNSSTQTFAFTHTPKLIFWGGGLQTLTDDYTVSGNSITFTGTLTPQTGDTVLNVY